MERDSGCYVTPNDNELSGVCSLFATMDRSAFAAPSTSTSYPQHNIEDTCMCQMEDGNAPPESSRRLLESCAERLGDSQTSHSSSSETDITGSDDAVTEVQYCERNGDPHEHSKV